MRTRCADAGSKEPLDIPECQRSNRGGRGAKKIRGSTPCTWICTRRCDATPNRSGAGYDAKLRRCGGLASAGGMAPGADGECSADTLALKKEIRLSLEWPARR
jgi:hypothetical protein